MFENVAHTLAGFCRAEFQVALPFAMKNETIETVIARLAVDK